MRKVVAIELLMLSIVIAMLLYVFGYIISPLADLISVPEGASNKLIRASKVMFWGAGGSIIVAIITAAGVIKKELTSIMCAVSAGVLLVLTFASLLWTSIFFFTVK